MIGRDNATTTADPYSWNDEAIFLDPWYDIVKTVAGIRVTDNFFDQYPLLRTANRYVETVSWRGEYDAYYEQLEQDPLGFTSVNIPEHR